MLQAPSTVRGRLRALALGAMAAALLAVPAAATAAPVQVDHVRATVTETSGNGDGLVGPGEGFSLRERIRNDDATVPTLTGVTGALSESATEITMWQSVSSYPDIAFGAEAENVVAYTGTVSPAAECGTAYDFTLNVNSAQGTAAVPFKLSTGAPGSPLVHDSTDVPKALPDLSTITSDLTVSDTGRVKDVSVRVGDLAHTATGDVKIELVAPDGTAVVLVDGRDGAGDNFTDTVFSDDAAMPISSADAPFTGTYRPEEPLSGLAGMDAQGTWKLRVTDQRGSDEGTLNAWGLDLRTAICNGSPIAYFTATPSPVLPGETLTLDASGSTDPNGAIVSYEWDLDGDGEYDDATGQTHATSFPTRGLHPIGLRVTDDNGDTGTSVIQVSVTDPPVAGLTASPASPLTGEETTLDGSSSSDPDGDPIARYEWDLDGDGEYEVDGGPAATTATQWASPGTRTVGLRVTDADGATATDTLDVVVRNRPPVPSFTHPTPVLTGVAITLDAGASTDPDSAIATYEWDFDGDGTFEHDGGPSPTVQHAFPASGEVTVGLRVTDEHDGSDTTTRVVTVTDPPVAAFTATPNPVSLQRDVQFDASGSSDPDGTVVRHEWDLDGNGSFETDTGAVAAASRSYGANGTYAVKLRVTDDDGAQATTTVNVVAANGLPNAAIAASPNPVTAGQTVLLDAGASNDPDGSIVKYDWDLDGNGSYEVTSLATPTRSHAYPNPGAFNVGVRVTDNHGGVRTAATQLSVLAAPTGTGGTGDTTSGGAGTGGAGGGATGSGTGADGGDAGDGGPRRFQASLTGRAIQRIALVRRRGLTVGCRTDRAATCVLRLELRARIARRLGMRAARRRATRNRPVVLARAKLVLRAGGARTARLRLTAAGRRALRRTRRVSVLVRGTATAAAGGRTTLARTFLLRR